MAVMTREFYQEDLNDPVKAAEMVKKQALAFGADAVGIGSIDRWEGCPTAMDPRQIMPEAKSVIGMVFRVNRGSMRGIEEGTFFSNYSAMGYGGLTYLYLPMNVINVSKYIEDRGFEVAIFHATGMGGMAFENIARGGGFAAVMDFALSEIGNLYAGSVVNSGEQRLRSAGGAGIPQIVAPGCIDLIDFAGWQDIPERFLDRPFHAHNRLIKCSAFNAAERRETARFVAERLAGARGPTHFILPAGGIEEWDKPGEPAHDPEGLAAFCDEVRKVMKPPVILSETAAHINDQGFADLALSILDGWIEDGTVAAPLSNKELKS